MIVREWRARAALSNQDDYPRHFNDDVLPTLRGIAGFLGATLGRRALGKGVEFVVLTRWESMVAIHAFAGTDCEKSVVDPDAAAMLTSFDADVQHYEVIVEA